MSEYPPSHLTASLPVLTCHFFIQIESLKQGKLTEFLSREETEQMWKLCTRRLSRYKVSTYTTYIYICIQTLLFFLLRILITMCVWCRMPVQYVIEEWDFRDLTLKMRPPVFIPRPETEVGQEKNRPHIRTMYSEIPVINHT